MDRTNETNENETLNQCFNGQDQRNQRGTPEWPLHVRRGTPEGTLINSISYII